MPHPLHPPSSGVHSLQLCNKKKNKVEVSQILHSLISMTLYSFRYIMLNLSPAAWDKEDDLEEG